MENLVGYAKDHLLVPIELEQDLWVERMAGLKVRAASWCGDVNAAVHSEIHAVPAQRLATESELLAELPTLRLEVRAKPTTRKIDSVYSTRPNSAPIAACYAIATTPCGPPGSWRWRAGCARSTLPGSPPHWAVTTGERPVT